ncbi:insulinase family protein [Bowmanella pacifica]|uniref:Protease 3 n=1 Tax=Bowmanella pacifica TaxID=502051 RepID=A0A917YT40_9ALTE|nr:insulinase family protein [Bowmanella pacifica]GGO64865.1 peptidase M16 [Bowmanella pacifica]
MPKWLVSLALLLPLTACQLSPSVEQKTTIVKGQQDPANYQYLELHNGLKVLLLSDAALSKAYASLTINAGYYQDPEQMPGLAHLYEHMLSKGSKRYPDAAEYKQFLAEQGGRSNASTSAQATNYYFEAAGDAFAPALDRFAWQFIAPILPAELVYKERHAVNAEFSMKFQDAFRRKREAMRTLFNPAHGYRKFSTGNLDTLRDTENLSLHQALLDFGQDYYCSSRMTLVLAGPQSLDELSRQAKEKFTPIEDNCRKTLEAQPAPLITGAPRQIDIKTLRKRQRLSLAFPLLASQASRDGLAAEYTEWLLESYNPDGLEAYLREQGLIQRLSASVSRLDDEHELLTIEFVLTNKGTDQQHTISGATLAYVKMLGEQGGNEATFQVFAKLSQARFNNAPQHVGANEVRRLSKRLQLYPATQVLTQGQIARGFNPEVLTEYWRGIRPDSMLVIREGRKLTSQLIEPIYQTAYARLHVSQTSIPDVQFATPKASPYFAEASSNQPAPNSLQQVLPGLTLWQLPSVKPKDSYTAITLYLDRPSSEPHFSALNGLLEKRLELQLEAVLEMAAAADIQAGVVATSSGLRLQIKGQSGNWLALFDDLLAALETPSLSESAYQQTLTRRINSIEGFKRERLSTQSIRLLEHQLGLASQPEEDVNSLRGMQENDYQAFVANYLTKAQMSLVVYGPVSSTEVEALTGRLQSLRAQIEQPSAISPNWDGQWHTPRQRLMVDGTDSAVRLVLQPKQQQFSDIAMLELFGSMIKAPFFHQLRTLEQLGYTVRANAAKRRGVHYLGYYVQSPVASAAQLTQRITQFNEDFLPSVVALNNEEFTQLKMNLIDALRQQRLNSSAIEADLREQLRYGRPLDWQVKLEEAILHLPLEQFKTQATTLLNAQLKGLLLEAKA